MTVPALSPVLTAGDPAPWFQTSMLAGEPRFKFDKAGGRHLPRADYDNATGGYFNAHRDNITPGTAQRRFATLPFQYDDAAAAIRRADAGSIVVPPEMAAPEPIGKPGN